MADLGNYQDKLIQDDEQNQNSQSANVTPTAGTSGVISGAASGGVSTAGVGAGGTGGWTNIQAYLNANKSDNGSAQVLSDKAHTQYDSEANKLQTSANETKSQAESQANKVKDAQDNSKQWINQAANAYNYNGQQNDEYNTQTQKVKSALYDPYAGPQNFAYQTSGDFQNTRSALGDSNSFNAFMNNLYKDKAGGTLTSGQGALQTQLDVNNQALVDTRQNLLNKYAGFDDVVNKTVTDTDAAIQGAKTSYGNNQEGLKTSLNNFSNEYSTLQAQSENAARDAYNSAFNSDSGKQIVGIGGITNSSIAAKGPWNTYSNATWKDINSLASPLVTSDMWDNAYDLGYEGQLQNVLSNAQGSYDSNKSGLNDFYTQQDQKYANTGDFEKRNWNTIMDILKNSARKQQGFQVRG